MDKLLNPKSQKILRQKLRNRMTVSEKILWYYLRGSNLEGYKFRRQYGVGAYIVDFYCPGGSLAIEIDGDSHYRDQAEFRDQMRQRWIEAQGIQVLRFNDNEVRENVEEVLRIILTTLLTTPNPSSKRRGN